jgi:predicted nucleic-acid-binding protein
MNMIGLDTNVLVRYIAQDDARQSAAAAKLIEKRCTPECPGYVSLVTLVELVWVTETCYDAKREEVATILRTLLCARQLFLDEAETVWRALRLFESSTADFADHLVERLAANAGCAETFTFDKKASKAGMKILNL